MLFNNTKIILTFLMTARLALSIVPDSEISIPLRSDWSTPKEITGLNLGPQKSWDDFHTGAITLSWSPMNNDEEGIFGNTKALIDEKAFFGTGGDVHWLSSSRIAMFFQKRNYL